MSMRSVVNVERKETPEDGSHSLSAMKHKLGFDGIVFEEEDLLQDSTSS